MVIRRYPRREYVSSKMGVSVLSNLVYGSTGPNPVSILLPLSFLRSLSTMTRGDPCYGRPMDTVGYGVVLHEGLRLSSFQEG